MNAPPAPPPETNFLLVIKPALDDIILTQTFTVFYIPLLIALFYFSSPASRKQPIFLLNVFTILLALASGSMLIARGYVSILFPLDQPPPSWNLATGVLGVVQSILVDTILLLRLAAVFPKAYIGPRRFYMLLTLPIILKVLRVTNLIIFSKLLVDASRNPETAAVKLAQIWENAPYLKIEWFSQLFDNSYASGFFLIRLYLRNRSQSRIDSRSAESRFTKRIKGLMYIAVTNFVIPALFSLVQIIIVYQEVNPVAVNDIILVNTSLAVIGVAFATIWAGTGYRSENITNSSGGYGSPGGTGNTPGKPVLSTMIFQSNLVQSSHGTMARSDVWNSAVASEEGRESFFESEDRVK